MPHDYATQEIADRFAALLDSFDYEEEYAILKINKIRVGKRRRVINEIKPLYVALWKLALSKSFPDQVEEIFDSFLIDLPKHFRARDKERAFLKSRVEVYNTLLAPNRETNFSEVANQLLESVDKKKTIDDALSLKFSLKIRKVYNMIFDQLI